MILRLRDRNINNVIAYSNNLELECLLCHKKVKYYAEYYSSKGENALCNECVSTLSQMFHVKRAEVVGAIQGKLKMTPMSEALLATHNDMVEAVDSLTPFEPIENERAIDVIMRLQNHNRTVNAVIRAKKLSKSIAKSDQYEIDYKEEMYKALDNKK